MDKSGPVLATAAGPRCGEEVGSDESLQHWCSLKPGASVQQAQADSDIISSRIREKDKRDASFGRHRVGMQEQVFGDVRRALLELMGSVGLVLVSRVCQAVRKPAAYARGGARERSGHSHGSGSRVASGSRGNYSRRVFFWDFMAVRPEMPVAQLSIYVECTMDSRKYSSIEDIAINSGVLFFTLGVSLATGILFGAGAGCAPSAVDLNTSLKAGGRSGQSDDGLYAKRRSLRGLLVVSRLTLSLMRLIGAECLTTEFRCGCWQRATRDSPLDHVLTMEAAARWT